MTAHRLGEADPYHSQPKHWATGAYTHLQLERKKLALSKFAGSAGASLAAGVRGPIVRGRLPAMCAHRLNQLGGGLLRSR